MEQFKSRKPKPVMEASFSNSSNQKPDWKYHVFLSFRGEDTRNGFADHLYAALKANGILTFRDDEELERGEVISPELVKAIQGSLFAIVILSPNYPSSSWCLDELQEILESRRVFGRQALPVFYGVDPSHMRHQREGIAKVFRKHEERFGKDSMKVQKWRDALKEISNLSGWDSRNW